MENKLFPFAIWHNNSLKKSEELEPRALPAMRPTYQSAGRFPKLTSRVRVNSRNAGSAPSIFPSRLEDAQITGRLPGSTGPIKITHQGRNFVKKQGNEPGHINEEMAAAAAYRYIGKKLPHFGISVPKFRHYRNQPGSVMLSQFVPNGQEVGAIPHHNIELRGSLKKQLQNGFAVDALLGNWDVIGGHENNILADANGKVHRIDTGGSLRYRAQGARKDPGHYGAALGDFWTMRGHSGAQMRQPNRILRTYFYDMDLGNLFDQYHDISDHLLTPSGRIDPGLAKVLSKHAETPEELIPLMEDRLRGVRAMSQHVKYRQSQGMRDRDIDDEMKNKFWLESRGGKYTN